MSDSNRSSEFILRVILENRIASLSPLFSMVLQALISARGSFGDASAFARKFGLRDRHQLAYLLRRDGLCPLRVLASWIKVAVWLVESECQHESLCRAALSDSQDPAARYRLVKRLTGVEWSQVQARGIGWLIEEMVEKCCVLRAQDRVAQRRAV